MNFFFSTRKIMFISMVADLVDDQELKTGQRQEGVFAAGVTFSTKAVGSLESLSEVFTRVFYRFSVGQGQSEINEDVSVWQLQMRL